tara:strand:+ start:2131 stop:2595 length:465 start_codon:yes stop_codon:yes gene_type:complete
MHTKDEWPLRKMLKIGLVAGNFDVIHPGYVKMFQDAKENACNYLIVALQSDPTIDRPEKSKPVQTIAEREYILSSIRYVDEILHYDTEIELLNILKNHDYDIRILGSDYDIPGKKYTGSDLKKPIYFHKRDHDYSATDLKTRIALQVMKESDGR